MKIEIKNKALIKNIQYLSKQKVDGKSLDATCIVENALALFFDAINKRADKIREQEKDIKRN